MTTVQLMHRIGRCARGGDFTALNMTEKTDVLQAATAALQELYGLLPTAYRELTEGFFLPAPLAVNNIGVTQYSSNLSSDVFTSEQVGRSVAINGDANWNTILDTDKLLNPYMGASGTVNAVVYGDAVYSTRYSFDRIIGNPTFPNRGAYPLLNRSLISINPSELGTSLYAQTIGEPQVWWTQLLGNSQGNQPILVLKVAPAPSIASIVDVRISYWPKRFTFSDYQAATTLPAPDQFLEQSLIPMAIQALMITPAWGIEGDTKRFDEAAERARQFLKLQPSQLAVPNNRVFTPFGF